jgi:hypothetical protein
MTEYEYSLNSPTVANCYRGNPLPLTMKKKTQIAIAGASGFIGTALCRELARDYDIAAPNFFNNLIHRRLEDMGGVYHLLEDPQTGQNPYLEKIKENMNTISSIHF